MTNETENQTTKTKQVPDFYIFENAPNGEKGGKPRFPCLRLAPASLSAVRALSEENRTLRKPPSAARLMTTRPHHATRLGICQDKPSQF
jgi:hypothetical protein